MKTLRAIPLRWLLVVLAGLTLMAVVAGRRPEKVHRQRGGAVQDPAPQAMSTAAEAAAAVLEEAELSRPGLPEFERFAQWQERYRKSAAKELLLQEGIALCTARGVAMKKLIQTDPRSALGWAISEADQKALPAPVRELLEKNVRGVGRMNVDAVVPIPGGPLPERSVIRGLVMKAGRETREYSAYVYGRRARELTASSTEFEGVVLENQLAVYDHEESGGYGRASAAWGDASAGSSDVLGRPDLNWTTGPKKVLIIRVDFSDVPGAPLALPGGASLDPAAAQAEFTNPGGLNEFYLQNSFGKTSLLPTVSPVYRMPDTALYYAQGDGTQSYSGQLRDVARAAAAADYDLGSYDRIGVVCTDLHALPNSQVGFAGVANLYGENFLIAGYYHFPVLAHEIGHTYGVNHANWWKPSNNTTLGTESDMLTSFTNGAMHGISLEYQDRFDVMGAIGAPAIDHTLHFNHWFKNLLGWVPDANVQTVTASGIYRIHPFDDPGADFSSQVVALKIGRDVRRDYWVGFRRQPLANSNLATGAYLLFGYNFNAPSDLLVCNNPGVNADNAGLAPGQSLVDSAAGVTIKTLPQAGNAPYDYLDIEVTLLPRVAFSQPLYAVDTTLGTVSVTVDRLGGSTGTTTVNYSVSNGTAIAGTHFSADPANPATLSWADGDNTPRTLSFNIAQPYAASLGARAFTVILSGVTNGAVINPGTATVSLLPPGNPDPAYAAAQMDRGIYSMALQPDGKVLAGGWFTQAGVGGGVNYTSGRIIRLNSDGTRDYSFESRVGANGNVRAIRLQADGKVLIAGNFTNVNNASPARPLVARLNSDGSLDPGFNPPVITNDVQGMAIQPDGKIVLVGAIYQVNGAVCRGLCRLLPDGTVDFIFNPPATSTSGGMQSVALDHFSHSAAGVRIFAAGTIIATGFNTQGYQAGVLCLKPDGTRDPGFLIGAGAQVAAGVTGFGNTTFAKAVAVQPDGKVLVGGSFKAFNNSVKSHLVRLNPSGAVDETFDPPVILASSGEPIIESIVVQPDGKVLVGGIFASVGGVAHSNLIRLTATGALDPEWDNGTGTSNGASQPVKAMLLRPDGRLLVSTSGYARIRGATAPESAVSTFQGVSTQTLFTGLLSPSGRGQFRLTSHGVVPGSVVQIAVQRVSGSAGAVELDYSTQAETAVAGSDYLTAQGTLSWAAGDSTPKTVSVQCPPGAVPGRTFRLNLAIPSAGFFSGAIPSTAVVISSTYNYAIWRSQNFDGIQQSSEAISAPAATPAGDGVRNLMKYALGLAPLVPAGALPVSISGERLQIGFLRDPLKTDLTYEVQASADLTNWLPLARSVAGGTMLNLDAFSVQETPVAGLMEVIVDDSTMLGAPQRFLRLQITK